ncbi:hypothetical protein MNBD_GAMMA12-3669 [hydrothermal vent metagenome]|uniref:TETRATRICOPEPTIDE REPEAT FAMILY PROTEIN n=1 Tax=hydrothermal vent metagenome TaxID=652676 RepID=A0A3B0Y6S0_9ZZZZ
MRTTNSITGSTSKTGKKSDWLVGFAVLMLISASASASVGFNSLDSLSAKQHITPKFDYLHLDREIDNTTVNVQTDYRKFRDGVNAYFQESFTDAINILLPLAKRNNSSAQFYVALMYDQGHGVIKNYSIAASWYSRAAKQGHIDAQYNLGIAYASGQGVKHSVKSAIHWWKSAAINGSVDAQYNLGMVYTTGNGIERNAMLAARWWAKAADKGDAAALFNLGVLYVNGGKGLQRNLCKAGRMWKQSAEQGFSRAKSALRMLQAMGRGRVTKSCWSTAKK